MKSKLEEMAKAYGKTADDLKDNEELKKYIEDNLKMEKTIDFIVTNAKIK